MSSPFISNGGSSISSGSGSLKVNYNAPDPLGNIKVVLSSLPDVDIVEESLATGELLSYNADSEKWTNIAQTPSTYPFSLFQALSQKGQASGYCGLDADSKIPVQNLPSIAITDIYTVNTIVQRDELTDLQQGDVCFVRNNIIDPTLNGSYMYNGLGWSQLSYIPTTSLGSLSDVNTSSLLQNDILM